MRPHPAASRLQGRSRLSGDRKELNWNHGKCTLEVQKFKATDNGEYKAVFPDTNTHKTKKIINVGPEEDFPEGTSLGTIAIVGLFMVALIIGIIVLILLKLKKRNELDVGVSNESSNVLLENGKKDKSKDLTESR